MSKTNKAFLNHGRWLVRCPKCGTPNRIEITDRTFICLICHPDMRATCLRPHPRRKGHFQVVPDADARAEALRKAEREKGVHAIAYELDPAKIESAVEQRDPAFRNWRPGEVIADLAAENKTKPWAWRERRINRQRARREK